MITGVTLDTMETPIAWPSACPCCGGALDDQAPARNVRMISYSPATRDLVFKVPHCRSCVHHMDEFHRSEQSVFSIQRDRSNPDGLSSRCMAPGAALYVKKEAWWRSGRALTVFFAREEYAAAFWKANAELVVEAIRNANEEEFRESGLTYVRPPSIAAQKKLRWVGAAIPVVLSAAFVAPAPLRIVGIGLVFLTLLAILGSLVVATIRTGQSYKRTNVVERVARSNHSDATNNTRIQSWAARQTKAAILVVGAVAIGTVLFVSWYRGNVRH